MFPPAGQPRCPVFDSVTLGAVTQPRLDEHPSLRVEFRHLAIKIHPIEKLHPRRVSGRHLDQALLEFDPDGHRINAHGVAGEARHKQIAPVFLLNQGAKC